ncbi:RICIN domain-containing protein [Streptomyces sp. NPDC001832]|uniref:RICIN domain-containing protein n=1 Tax=Streptomyces sp. NPDC001832 TaxID=3154527 RepID=UPI003327A72D
MPSAIRTFGPLLAAATAVVGLGLTAPSASAAPTGANGVVETYQNKVTGRCLDDSQAGLRAFGCNNLPFQQWDVMRIGDLRQLRNLATNGCLDDSFAYGLRTVPCYGNKYQQWKPESAPGGITLTNAATGRRLDDSLAFGLRPLAPNGTDFQIWK